jgi:uncharacterized protein YbjT (DUF2867 family)
MSKTQLKVLVVGAAGSIGRLVLDEAIRQGHGARVLVHDVHRASQLRPVSLHRGVITTLSQFQRQPRWSMQRTTQ